MRDHHEKLNRALWASCMGNMSMAAAWLKQAESAIIQGQSEIDFIAHAHPSGRAKARAAHRLANYQAGPQSIAEAAGMA